jgi:nicotinamidase-related amidase
MNVVNLRVYRDSRYTPLVIFVDPQKEYVAANRALELRGISAAIERCRELLDFTRANGFPTVFMRWKQRGKFFSSHQPFGDWIDGLSPIGSDMIFERALPSCYASEAFAELMDQGGGDNAVIAGFTGAIACLSTLVESYHRKHNITFLADASASHPLAPRSEAETHDFTTQLISLYAPVTTTGRWIEEQARLRQGLGSVMGAASE